MASTVIHMAVANAINKVIKRKNDILLIGSIAPDISKQIGQTKVKSHFLNDENDNVPNINEFLDKYRDKMNDDFVLGYFIHLYTDYLWFKYFLPEIYDSENSMISKIDGSTIKCDDNMLNFYIYNDYTNLNTILLDEYNMNLGIFYNDIPHLENIIDEIPMEKIKIIIDKASIIIENSKKKKDFIFNIDNIKTFIKTCTELILAKMQELNLL